MGRPCQQRQEAFGGMRVEKTSQECPFYGVCAFGFRVPASRHHSFKITIFYRSSSYLCPGDLVGLYRSITN